LRSMKHFTYKYWSTTQTKEGGNFDNIRKNTKKPKPKPIFFFKESRRPPLSFGFADFSSSAACTSLQFRSRFYHHFLFPKRHHLLHPRQPPPFPWIFFSTAQPALPLNFLLCSRNWTASPLPLAIFCSSPSPSRHKPQLSPTHGQTSHHHFPIFTHLQNQTRNQRTPPFSSSRSSLSLT